MDNIRTPQIVLLGLGSLLVFLAGFIVGTAAAPPNSAPDKLCGPGWEQLHLDKGRIACMEEVDSNATPLAIVRFPKGGK